MAKTIKTTTKAQSKRSPKHEGQGYNENKDQETLELKTTKAISSDLMKELSSMELTFGDDWLGLNFIVVYKSDARSRVQDLTSGEIVSLNLN
ncbi:hypothetical protein Tco_0005548 [Tanacetum coccineum]